jgi:hypothetical protein
MPRLRIEFEPIANAAGYFRMHLTSPRTRFDYEQCVHAGFFSQDILLTLNPETKADPSRRELKSSVSEIAPGVFQPRSTIDWLEMFGGSWSITASVTDEVWLDQFLKNYSNPYVPTYTTIEDSSFSELVPVLKIRSEAILVSLGESRGVTVVGRGAAYERIVHATAIRRATIDQAKRYMADGYSASAQKEATKFAQSVARIIGSVSDKKYLKKKPVEKTAMRTLASNKQALSGANLAVKPSADDIRKIYLSSTLVGSNWFFDSANVAHLNFYSEREILKETQELLEHLEEVESGDGLDGEKAIAIGQFLQSGDRIALMLTGHHAGSIVMFFHDVDDQIISPNLTQFVEQLKADNSLLKRFGVAKFNRSGKLIDPYKL